jgi:chromosome partitioning protein
MGKVLVIANRKGGVGKTMTAASLGAGLVRHGKRVICIDADAQHSLTVSFEVNEPEKLPVTLSTVMSDIIKKIDRDPLSGIIRHSEGVDLMPSNSSLAAMELALAGLIGRETVLRQYIERIKPFYDYIIVDSAPSLGLLTINALTAAGQSRTRKRRKAPQRQTWEQDNRGRARQERKNHI